MILLEITRNQFLKQIIYKSISKWKELEVVQIHLLEEFGASARRKTIEFLVEPQSRFIPGPSFLDRLFKTGHWEESLESTFDKGIGFKYLTGKKGEVPALLSKFTFWKSQANESQSPRVFEVNQSALLGNPEKGPEIRGYYAGAIYEIGFCFAIGLDLNERVKGKSVISNLIKSYTPSQEGGAIYNGHTNRMKVIQELPDPLKVQPSRSEMSRVRKGRVNGGLLEENLPKTFTLDQAVKMLDNIIEGKVFTAGVWNPRQLSTKKSSLTA